jgi:hypothetical protein
MVRGPGHPWMDGLTGPGIHAVMGKHRSKPGIHTVGKIERPAACWGLRGARTVGGCRREAAMSRAQPGTPPTSAEKGCGRQPAPATWDAIPQTSNLASGNR